MLDSIYTVDQREREAFGKHWCGPVFLEHGEWTLVAVYPKTPDDGDGQAANVYACALPARFYRVEVLPDTNSGGEPKDGFTLGTGSEMALLCISIAKAASEGMLALK